MVHLGTVGGGWGSSGPKGGKLGMDEALFAAITPSGASAIALSVGLPSVLDGCIA